MFHSRNSIPTFIAFLCMRTAVWAHPGHGATDPDGIVHHVVEPTHGWWIVLLSVIIGGGYLSNRFYRTKKAKAFARKSRNL